MSNRELNRKLASEHLNTINKGSYTVGNRVVQIGNFEDAEYIKYDTLGKLGKVQLANCDINKLNIQIFNGSTVDAVIKEAKHKDKIGVLNFASAMHPGGGFINGAMAQEEALCQASTLYLQLRNNKMYKDNAVICKDGFYNNSMAVCDTIFIKDSKGNTLINPVKAFVVTSAAVNVSRLNNNGPAVDMVKVESIMYSRMEEVIKQFIRAECKTLILGAFGCGVFGNNPQSIAEIWKELLERYGGHINKVVFAVLDRGGTNIQAFKDTFN